MNPEKRKRLEAAGWRVGSAGEFLALTPAEAAFVETKLALSEAIRSRRAGNAWTQAELAQRIGSSQSRIARAEAADPSVSMDLMVRALYATGATPADLAGALVLSRSTTPMRRPTGGTGT
jgi:hypothetical protein